ncbi:MAG: zeta toxin family protein [Candidatus Moraniibacteriota bacterium]
MKEDELIEKSKSWIRSNKKMLIEKFIGDISYIPDIAPFSMFMAGSPGAGKTESSKRFIKDFIKRYNRETGNTKKQINVVRIDPDEIRELIPGYTGANAELFQGAVSLGVEKLYDYVIAKKLSVVVDGTFANYAVAHKNIKRAVDKKRKVGIFYIYQDPLVAWDFTKKREDEDGRRIKKTTFIEAFFKAKINVNKIKVDFGNNIEVLLIMKNYKNDVYRTRFNVDKIDNYLKIKYTKKSLIEKIC